MEINQWVNVVDGHHMHKAGHVTFSGKGILYVKTKTQKNEIVVFETDVVAAEEPVEEVEE